MYRRTACALGAMAMATVAGASAASAASTTDERVRSDALHVVLAPDGTMHVSETLDYDFGTSAGRHGIDRALVLSQPYDSGHDRVYRLTHVDAASPSGAPAGVTVLDGDPTTIRVGDPDRTVTGRQTYVLSYDLAAVLTTTGDRQRLEWNATSDTWTVPVDASDATVTGPVAPTAAACREGSPAAPRTCDATISGTTATYRAATALQPGQGLTVVADYPIGTFPATAPILTEQWSLQRAFSLTPLTVGAAAGILLLVTGWTVRGAARAWRGRRPQADATPSCGPGRPPPGGATPPDGPGQPPPGVHPADVARLLPAAEGADGVAATLVDLAMRGYCRVEELVADSPDWRLVRSDRSTSELPLRERRLLLAVLPRREPVALSGLGDALFGLDPTDPADAGHGASSSGSDGMFLYLFASVWLTIGGLIGTVFLAIFTPLALLGSAVFLAGPVLVLARWLELRWRSTGVSTGGSTDDGPVAQRRPLGRLRAFHRYLETADPQRVAAAGTQEQFVGQLPFAIAFGLLPAWADVVTGLTRAEVRLAPVDWYRPASGGPAGPADVADGIQRFVAEVVSLVDSGATTEEDDAESAPGGPADPAWDDADRRAARNRPLRSGAGTAFGPTSSWSGSSGSSGSDDFGSGGTSSGSSGSW